VKLGFEKRIDAPTVRASAGSRWRRLARRRRSLSFARAGGPTGVDTHVRFSTRDAEADHADLQPGASTWTPEVMPYPVPMFVFRDPDGNRLVIVERD